MAFKIFSFLPQAAQQRCAGVGDVLAAAQGRLQQLQVRNVGFRVQGTWRSICSSRPACQLRQHAERSTRMCQRLKQECADGFNGTLGIGATRCCANSFVCMCCKLLMLPPLDAGSAQGEAKEQEEATQQAQADAQAARGQLAALTAELAAARESGAQAQQRIPAVSVFFAKF